MPVIPITSRTDPRFADTPPNAQGMPSETNLLMALAEMQRQGRFNQVSDTQQDNKEIPFSSLNKNQQNNLLMGHHSTMGKQFKTRDEVLKFMEDTPHPRLFRDDPGVQDLLKNPPKDLDVIDMDDKGSKEGTGSGTVILQRRKALTS